MSGSNRNNIAAIGLIATLALSGLMLLIDSANDAQSRHEESAQRYAKNYADNATKELERCVTLAPESRSQCESDANEARRKGERDEYDLEAQRITATWTQHMGIAAIIGMAVSIVGVVLVWTTFREAQRSAQISLDNLEAYRSIEAGKLVPEPEWQPLPAVQIRAKNIGASDAHVVHADVGVFTFDRDVVHAIPTKISKRLPLRSILIPPDQKYTFDPCPIEMGKVSTVAGGVIYTDRFGRLHLCCIAIDVVPSNPPQMHSSAQIDFSKWHDAMKRLERGETITPSEE